MGGYGSGRVCPWRPACQRGTKSAGRCARLCLRGDGRQPLSTRADLVHPLVAETTETLSERTDRDAFDRIEIHCETLWDRVAIRLEDDFAREATDVGCARSNQGAPEPGDRNVARQDNDRTAGDLGQFAPPDFSPARQLLHDDAAARRNDARSPHSSDSSSGCTSYAV